MIIRIPNFMTSRSFDTGSFDQPLHRYKFNGLTYTYAPERGECLFMSSGSALRPTPKNGAYNFSVRYDKNLISIGWTSPKGYYIPLPDDGNLREVYHAYSNPEHDA